MSSRLRIRKKSTRVETPDISTAPAQGMFQSRPFVVQTHSAEKSQQQPDLKIALMRAQRYGHHLGRMQPAGLKAPTAVQPKLEMKHSVESHKAKAPQMLQAKLSVGAPGDMYEQEADAVAAQVVDRINGSGERSPAQHTAQEPAQSQSIQQRKKKKSSEPLGLNIQPLVQRESAGNVQDAKPHLERSTEQKRGGGQPLSGNIRKPMERSFGADFRAVKVHHDAQSDKLNQSIQAKAFATGQDIFFRQGTYNSQSREGQQLLAHELTHVVQQNGTAVQSKALQKTALNNVIQRTEKKKGIEELLSQIPEYTNLNDDVAKAEFRSTAQDISSRAKSDEDAIKRLKGYVQGLAGKAKTAGKTLEEFLIARNQDKTKQAAEQTEIQPHGQFIDSIPALEARAKQLIEQLKEDQKIPGVRDFIKKLKGELNGPIQDMRTGKKEANKERYEGAENNIEGIEAEWQSGKSRENLQQYGMKAYFTPEGSKEKTYADVDVVADEGKTWVEVKSYKPFSKEHENFDSIRKQLERLMVAAKNNPVDGEPPRIVVHFPKGVFPDVKSTYESIIGEGNVEGPVVEPESGTERSGAAAGELAESGAKRELGKNRS